MENINIELPKGYTLDRIVSTEGNSIVCDGIDENGNQITYKINIISKEVTQSYLDNEEPLANESKLIEPEEQMQIFDDTLELELSPDVVQETCTYFHEELSNKKKVDLQGPLVKWSRTGKVGLKYFSKFLSEIECSSLKTLNLKWKGLGAEGMEYFARAIVAGNMPNLAILDISDGKIGDEGMEILANAFINSRRECPDIKELNLCGNELGDKSMEYFWNMLNHGKCNFLEKLNLNNNNIGFEGMRFLSLAICAGKFDRLTRLLMKNNHIQNPGFNFLMNALSIGRGRSLEIINLHKNGILRVDVGLFETAMKTVKKLQQLVITRNKIEEADLESMRGAIGSVELQI